MELRENIFRYINPSQFKQKQTLFFNKEGGKKTFYNKKIDAEEKYIFEN